MGLLAFIYLRIVNYRGRDVTERLHVVAPIDSGYLVIDGQQRLTTIYIILSVLNEIKKFITEENFTLEYETRKNSEEFLKNIDLSRKEENIDYYHICEAYETIEQWFANKPGSSLNSLNSTIDKGLKNS